EILLADGLLILDLRGVMRRVVVVRLDRLARCDHPRALETLFEDRERGPRPHLVVLLGGVPEETPKAVVRAAGQIVFQRLVLAEFEDLRPNRSPRVAAEHRKTGMLRPADVEAGLQYDAGIVALGQF